jgi:hypothetical protein
MFPANQRTVKVVALFLRKVGHLCYRAYAVVLCKVNESISGPEFSISFSNERQFVYRPLSELTS